MANAKKERRKFPRLKLELIVRYKILADSAGNLEAQTIDISAGGVCLVTRERIKTGTVLVMDIKFPQSDKPVIVEGRAIWSAESSLGLSPAGHKRFDNGIEFVQISDSDRQRIIEHVKVQQEKTGVKDWKIGIVRELGL